MDDETDERSRRREGQDVSPRRRVLVVDDEPTIREVVGQYLEPEGYSVIKAAGSLEGLRMAETCLPDPVIAVMLVTWVVALILFRNAGAELGTLLYHWRNQM
jgi:PleD family two-component response regulator